MAVTEAPARRIQNSTSAQGSIATRAIAVHLIDASPTNPRKTFIGIEELAMSIAELGLQQPPKVRPKGDRFELVFGERRLRAVKLLKWDIVEVIVEDLTDPQVLEIQIVENENREDVSPLEKAEGYRNAIKSRIYGKGSEAVLSLAAKLGISKSSIYALLSLERLIPEAKEALSLKQFDVSIAVELARLRAEDQKKALPSAIGATVKQFRYFLERDIFLDLEKAVFSLVSEDYYQKAGPCSQCPKRADRNAEQLGLPPSKPYCMDRKCYEQKSIGLVQQLIREYEAEGTEFCLLDENYWGNDSGGEAYGYPVVGRRHWDVVREGGIPGIVVNRDYQFPVGTLLKVKIKGQAEPVDPEYKERLDEWKKYVVDRDQAVARTYRKAVIEKTREIGLRTDARSLARTALVMACHEYEYSALAAELGWPLIAERYKHDVEKCLSAAREQFEKATDEECLRIVAIAPLCSKFAASGSNYTSPKIESLLDWEGIDLKTLKADSEALFPVPEKPAKPAKLGARAK